METYRSIHSILDSIQPLGSNFRQPLGSAALHCFHPHFRSTSAILMINSASHTQPPLPPPPLRRNPGHSPSFFLFLYDVDSKDSIILYIYLLLPPYIIYRPSAISFYFCSYLFILINKKGGLCAIIGSACFIRCK